ncbi:MAG TPA: sigma 54-interacting transcriptional regulator [Gemmataceae bacterium]|nr:sigma 54-interacting transcriptional regulator [Gemmataceae bacterium]
MDGRIEWTVGHRLAPTYRSAVPPEQPQKRVDQAISVLRELEGFCKSETGDHPSLFRVLLGLMVMGYPQVCRLVEALLADVLGLPVQERCQMEPAPQCCFEIETSAGCPAARRRAGRRSRRSQDGSARVLRPSRIRRQESALGTLFVDEVPGMAPALQANLLRVLEDYHCRRVSGTKECQADVRVIVATNKPLEDRAEVGPLPRGPLLPPQYHQHRPPPRSRSAATNFPR